MPGIGQTSNGLGWSFLGLATIAVGLRLAASRTRGGYFRLDDYVMIISLLMNLFSATFNSVAINYGLGQHIRDLSPENIPRAGLWAVVADAIAIYADSTPKLAVALLVNRILLPRPIMRTFHIVLTVILILFTTAVVLLSILQCHPVAHQWDPEGVPGSCLDPQIFQRVGIADGALSCFVDLYFSFYPPIVISRLNMSTKSKLIAGVTMSLGLFTLFTTLYKTAAVLPRLNAEQADVTYTLAEVILWGLLEASVTVIAGSIPTWGWLFRTRTFQNFVTWITIHNSQNDYHIRGRPQAEQDDIELQNGPGKVEAAKRPLNDVN